MAATLLRPDSPLAGITAAAWNGATGEFFLLAPSRNQLYRASVGAGADAAAREVRVSGPFHVPIGQVAPRAFAVSDDTVFTVIDGQVHRLALSGASAGAPIALLDGPSQTGMTAAHAGGWLLVGIRNAPAQALEDGTDTPILAVTPEASDADAGTDGAPAAQPPGLSDVFQVTTDGDRFGVALLSGARATLHQISPGHLVPNPWPCDMGPVFNATNGTGMSGATVAWVTQPGAGPYRLHFGAFEPACAEVATIPFGESTTGSKTVGLIDGGYALVVSELHASRASVQILRRSTSGPVGAPVANIDLGTGRPLSFVMGSNRAAVLVTGDLPAFIGY